MRILLSALILFFCISSSLFSEDDALSSLEKLAASHRDDRLYYNLGVLYANSGNVGKAILNLKKASLLRPSDPETVEILNSLRQSIGIPPYLFESTPIEKALFLPFSVFSMNGAFVFGLILFCLGSSLLAVLFSNLLMEKIGNFENRIKAVSIILLTIGVIYILSSLIRFQTTFDKKNAVVLADSRLLERPDEQALQLSAIPGGMECVVKSDNGDYYLIDSIDGHEGWIQKNVIERLWEGK